MKIPNDIINFYTLFKKAGKELFLVGGCVRDFKLGKKPKDFDMATNAFPEEIENILFEYSFDLTGKSFGVMRVYTKDEPVGYEIATYREDESVGRNPIVKIGSTIEKDSIRRDLTINAMYYDIENKIVIDFNGGLKDLEDKIIRTPGNPIDRINEDKLRLPRAIRMREVIEGEFDPALKQAMLNNWKLEGPGPDGKIIPIPAERIMEEFLKGLLQIRNISSYILLLKEFKTIEQIFPGLSLNTQIYSSYNFIKPCTESVIANLLRFNTNLDLLWNSLVYVCKLDKKRSNGVKFLLMVENINADNAYYLKKYLKNKTDLTMNDVIKHCENLADSDGFYHQQMKFIRAFELYEIKTNGDDLKKEGFKDEAVGKELELREKNNFLQLIK